MWDVQNLYSDAQSFASVSTGNTDSTNVINQLAAGDAYVDPAFLRIQVGTAFTSGGSATIAINLLTADNSSFTNATTFPIVPETAYTAFTAGKVLYQGRMPLGMKQYHKLVYVIGTAGTTAGTVTAGLRAEVPTNRM